MRILYFVFCILLVSSLAAEDKLLKFSSSNFIITVPPFSIDNEFSYTGGEIQALPEKKQYLVLNLKNKSLHVLQRAISDGEIVLAIITTSDSGIADIQPQPIALPTTRIPNALEKISSGKSITIKCFGSSLVENDHWQHLLTDATIASPFYIGNISNGNIPNITRISHGVGGSNAQYTISLFGTALFDGKNFPSTAYNCDLAIVALLPNGGENRLSAYEGVVRMLRQRNIEVLLLTDNSYAGQGEHNGLWCDGEFVKKLADRYGCALADTAAYMLEADLRGEKVYADQIHQAKPGHSRWAEAISGVLSTGVTLKTAPPVPSSCFESTIENRDTVAKRVEVEFVPSHQGGEVIDPAKVERNNLAKIYQVPFGRIDFSAGDQFILKNPHMFEANIIIDSSTAFKADVCELNSGQVIKTITLEANQGARPKALTTLSRDNKNQVSGDSVKVVVKEGVLRLFAVSYHISE